MAIDLDPGYAQAHTLLATTDVWDRFMEWSTGDSLDRALESAQRALALDDGADRAHAILGFVLFLRGRDQDAEIHFARAVALNPNDADVAAFMADFLVYLGRWRESLEWIGKAKRLNPFHPPFYHWYSALAAYSAHEYAQAVRAIRDRWHHAYLAACYGQLGRVAEARAEIAIFIEAREREVAGANGPTRDTPPNLALERANRYRLEADRNHFLDGLRKAGLPD